MKKISLAALIILVLIFALMPSVQAQSPQQTLNKYISDLQKNPNNYALREKIIKHVQGMKPKPAIPENAREHFVMANTFQKEAKDKRGYELAIKEYKDALLIAPWWPEAYNNMGILQKLAGKYDEAIQSLNLYLLTNPADARNAQDEIYKIKAAKKMAASERTATTTSTAPAEKQKTDLDVSGRWRSTTYACSAYMYNEYRLDGDNLYVISVFEDKTITDTNCQQFSKYRGQRREGSAFMRSGKNEFRRSDSVLSEKIEFIGDKAFWTMTVFCCSDQNGSGINIRER